MYNQKHEFAIYYNFSCDITINEYLKIVDEQFHHRLVRVLRLNIDDLIIIFNRDTNISAKIIEINKKYVLLQVFELRKNIELKPRITMLVSLLKKEAFEEAVYLCTELGANVIQPIVTKKSYQKKFDSKDYDRLHKIIISAAEQSKNFKYPELMDPIHLEDFLKINKVDENSVRIFFDSQGSQIESLLNKIVEKKSDIYMLIGPEGDLTNLEKEFLKQAGFIFCSLTPTILRAQIACAVALGSFRAYLK